MLLASYIAIASWMSSGYLTIIDSTLPVYILQAASRIIVVVPPHREEDALAKSLASFELDAEREREKEKYVG